MGTIVEDIQVAAEWIAQTLQDSGNRADFSPESLWQIDFFLDDNVRNGKPIRGGLLSQDLGTWVFALGAYVGEVLRRNKGGEWEGDDADPEVEINVALKLSSGIRCWPMQRVIKRVISGSEDGLADYGTEMGLQIGSKPARLQSSSTNKPWWKFW
jgi:hypothetical protein